jgi:tetratricopeptide (TPR) repeat protein
LAASDIPDYLVAAPRGEPSPPIDTSAQELPFDRLGWEDFERLCLRLAQQRGTPEHVQSFGSRGQDQAGIDIYSRSSTGGYAVYQCKRYATLRPADVRTAVNRFLAGEWHGRAQEFVFCTSKSVVHTKLAYEIERQAERLADQHPPVKFTCWDAETLSGMLKGYPQLVRDFFGTAWLERFFGGEHVARPPVPRQLPPVPGGFVNRERDLGSIDSVISRPRPAGVSSVVVLAGGHGVGKTAISRKWAHANSDRFSDGQLYADFSALRYRGGIGVGDVLGGFLRALGLPSELIPVSLDERSALFRSSTAGKRLLVLLDDVDHAAQVRPLIPGAPGSAVMVTTRAPLEELFVYENASRVRLRPLPLGAAEELLGEMVGKERLKAEPSAVMQLAAICAGLPVALRICGARLATHEHRPVSWLVEELADEAQRLRRIHTEPAPSLQAVFDEAYRALDEDAAVTYRRLGLHSGPSFTISAIAAAAGLPIGRASGALDQLLIAHLVEDAGDRFTFHDLLRLHARGVALAHEPIEQQAAAVHRIVAFYLRSAQRMDYAMIPVRLRLTDGPPDPSSGEPSPASAAEAFALFEAERPNLVSAIRTAMEREWYSEVWQFGEALFLAYHNHKHHEEALELFAWASRAARQLGYRDAEVRMLSQLALAHLDVGDDAAAAVELAECRSLMEGSRNRELWASIREWTGTLEVERGNYSDAISAFEEARSAFESVGNVRGVALQDLGMGHALNLAGNPSRAVRCLLRAATLIDAEVDGLTFGRVLLRLGEAYRLLGDSGQARPVLENAVEVMRRNDAPLLEARARESLAEIDRESGDIPAAVSNLERALSIYSALSSPRTDLISAQLAQLQS